MTTSLPSLPSLLLSMLLLMTACVDAEDAPEPEGPELFADTGETADPPLDHGLATEPLDEYGGCKIGGCCDCNQVSSTGTQSCMGCSGAMSAADCGDQTYVPCPPDMCFIYGGKFAYKPGASWAPSACK